jgi:type I restriction enzyme S subunit
MELKLGYKQTEVGVIPEDWAVRPLGQLGSWRGGATPSMQNSAFWANGTIPWVSSGDVKSVSMSDSPMKITDYAVRNSGTTVLPTNSIIIVVRSGILRKYLPVSRTTRPLAINQDIKALIPDVNHVPSYLLHLLTWSGPKILATCLKSGTTVESIEFRWLKSFCIPLPPTKAEQEAIAEALSAADAFIESLEQLIAKKRQIKQGAMQALLTGKRRLPGFATKPGDKQTEVGIIPEEWGLRPLGEVVTFLDGKRRPVKDADRAKIRGSIPYYGASGIVDYVNDYLFDEELILLAEDGENILSRNSRLAFRISGKAWVNNHAHVLRPNPDVSVGFLTDYLESLNYERFNSGTAQPKLNKQICIGIPVTLPPTKAEQTAIAAILSTGHRKKVPEMLKASL